MRHQRRSKKFSRPTNQRKLLQRSLLTSLIMHGEITTTLVKAKLLKQLFDKLISKTRSNPNLAKQKLYAQIPNKQIVNKIITDVIPNLSSQSGLTSIAKLGPRPGDNTEMARIKILTKETEMPTDNKKPNNSNTLSLSKGKNP